MKGIIRLASALMVASSLSACVIAVGDDTFRDDDHRRIEVKNKDRIEMLEIGNEFAAVRERMGAPDFSEAFEGKDGHYKVLFYRTHRVDADGETKRNETTPVVFRDGKLIGYGNKVYDAVIVR